MVYVHLASGKEVLLIGDITWAMAGIELQRQKPEGVSEASARTAPQFRKRSSGFTMLGES